MYADASSKAARHDKAEPKSNQAAVGGFSVPYRVRTSIKQRSGSILRELDEDEDPNAEEEGGTGDDDESAQLKRAHEKSQFRWQSSRKAPVSGWRSKRKTHRSKHGELLRLTPTPLTSFGPGSDRPSVLLGCDLPDAFLQEQLHNSQWPDETVSKHFQTLTLDQSQMCSPIWCPKVHQARYMGTRSP